MATSTKDVLDVRTKKGVKFGKELRKEFLFDENFLNLNHGEIASLLCRSVLSSYQSSGTTVYI